MQISIRSSLTAGMTAVVGAGAVAIAPAVPVAPVRAIQLPAPAIAEIALTGTSLPLDQIWTLVQSLGASLGSGGGISGVVNVVFSAVGTEFAAQALPLVTAALTDVTQYLGAALVEVFAGGGVGQIDFPGIVTGVGTALGAGDIPGALQTLTGGLTAPLTNVVHTVFGPDFQTFLSGKVGGVLGALPEVLRSAVQKVLGLDIKPVTDAIVNALSGLLPKAAAAATPPGPVALATAEEAPTIVGNMPAVRDTSAPSAAAVPAAAASTAVAEQSPADVAVAEADAPAAPAPAKADSPAESPAPAALQQEAEAPVIPRAVTPRRGAAVSEEDGSTAVAASSPATRHRGTSDASGASGASGQRSGR